MSWRGTLSRRKSGCLPPGLCPGGAGANTELSRFFPTKPGHFSRTLSKGPNTTTWIWNLHADAHDFDSHTSDLEEISRKVFSAHFGQLGVIFIWLSGGETNLQKQGNFFHI